MKLRVLHVHRDLPIKHLEPTTITGTEQPYMAVMCDSLHWKIIAEYLQVIEKCFFSGDRATDETKPEHAHFRARQIPP